LHVFSDASSKAFAASVYMHFSLPDGQAHVALVMMKPLMAPLKPLANRTINFCGAQVGRDKQAYHVRGVAMGSDESEPRRPRDTMEKQNGATVGPDFLRNPEANWPVQGRIFDETKKNMTRWNSLMGHFRSTFGVLRIYFQSTFGSPQPLKRSSFGDQVNL
ncbi:hypothetical protein TSAR_000275, partial [Trichomalopsis sarcophagae]